MERKKRMDRISMTRICKYSNICERLCKYLKTIFTVKTEHTITHKYIQSLCKRQQHKMRWANVDMLSVVEDKKRKHIKTEDYRQIGFLRHKKLSDDNSET